MQKTKKLSGKKLALLVALVLIAVVAVLCAKVLLGSYAAEPDAVIAATVETGVVHVSQPVRNRLVFYPEKPVAGLVFYPGAKVEFSSYSPLMHKLARNGILCVLVEMPANIALFYTEAAKGIPEQYPEIDTWYIGGHSLGGSAAAMYAQEHPDDFDGLLLLASYSTVDLSETELNVISIYGENDLVLNRKSYEKNRSHLPEPVWELVIPGGNHAQFGSYGEQDRDGAAEITAKEQRAVTTAFCLEHMK